MLVDRLTVARAAFALAVTALLGGCAHTFPRQYFAIEAQDADYPVMLSDTQPRSIARPILGESGTMESQGGNVRSWGHSAIGASEKLAAQVRRSDEWLQIERAEYGARDYFGGIAASEERHLKVMGTVQP